MSEREKNQDLESELRTLRFAVRTFLCRWDNPNPSGLSLGGTIDVLRKLTGKAEASAEEERAE